MDQESVVITEQEVASRVAELANFLQIYGIGRGHCQPTLEMVAWFKVAESHFPHLLVPILRQFDPQTAAAPITFVRRASP